MSDYRIIDADGHVMELDDEAKRRIFFDNPLRFYPRLRARIEKQPALAAAASSVQGTL